MFNFLKQWYTKRKRKRKMAEVPVHVLMDLVDCTLSDLPYPYSQMRAGWTPYYDGIRIWHMGQYRDTLCVAELRDRLNNPHQFIRYLKEKLK